ncbi:MAG: hypothetical protein ABSG62_04790 [Terracidiphilus sp.]
MRGFRTIREAKEYLAGKIAEEAEREGTPLTEVERKMLYFTETGWTLPDMKEVSAEFDRDYDQDEYERKIAGLVRGIEAQDGAESEQGQGTWGRAVEKLSEGDHYLLVLIDAASSSGSGASSRWGWLKPFVPTPSRPGQQEPGDIGRLIVAAFAVIFGVFLVHFLLGRIFGPDWYDDVRHFFR